MKERHLCEVLVDLELYAADCRKAADEIADDSYATIIQRFEWIESLMENALAVHGRTTPESPPDEDLLDKNLELARDELAQDSRTILAQLVTHEVEAALKRDDVDIKRNAFLAYKQMGADIPF